MKKQLIPIALAAVTLFSCGGANQNQTTVNADSTAKTESAPEPQKIDKKVEITLSIIKQLWMGVPDSVLTADKVALTDTITNFYYFEEADEESDVEFDFELNLDCYFYTIKSDGYKVLVYSSSYENRARHRWINLFTCKGDEATQDEMFSNNTGYVQFEMYDDGKFWVEDYIPGEEATYQWNGENFVTVPTEKPNEEESSDEATADEANVDNYPAYEFWINCNFNDASDPEVAERKEDLMISPMVVEEYFEGDEYSSARFVYACYPLKEKQDHYLCVRYQEQTDRYGLDVSEIVMGIAMSEYENNPFEPKYIEKQEKKYDFDHRYVVIDGYILSFDDDGFLLKFKGQDVFMKWNGEKFVE